METLASHASPATNCATRVLLLGFHSHDFLLDVSIIAASEDFNFFTYAIQAIRGRPPLCTPPFRAAPPCVKLLPAQPFLLSPRIFRAASPPPKRPRRNSKDASTTRYANGA